MCPSENWAYKANCQSEIWQSSEVDTTGISYYGTAPAAISGRNTWTIIFQSCWRMNTEDKHESGALFKGKLLRKFFFQSNHQVLLVRIWEGSDHNSGKKGEESFCIPKYSPYQNPALHKRETSCLTLKEKHKVKLLENLWWRLLSADRESLSDWKLKLWL
jgi:hypothetical protein